MNVKLFFLIAFCALSSFAGAQGLSFTKRLNPGKLNWTDVTSSSDGTKLAAVVAEGQLYTSTDSGVSWTTQTNAGSRNWSVVSSSSDGLRLGALGGGDVQKGTWQTNSFVWSSSNVSGRQRYWRDLAISASGTMWLAVDEGAINSSFRQGGEIYTSIDNGNNWVAKPSAGIRNWHRVAMSADGQKLLASEDFGQVFLSTDGASSWAPLTIETEKGKFISDVACSADGVTIVVCTANSGTELPSGKIFISSDSGITWVERSPPPETDDLQQWKDLAISSDGMKIFVVASLGYVYSSVNQGQNWTAHKTSSGEDSLKLEWRAISCSSDGLRVAACACNQWIFTAE